VYLDNWHTTESVSYLVVEAGFWELADGGSYDAGVAFVDGSESRITFNCEGSMPDPVVFTQIVSADQMHGENPQALVTRVKDVQANNGFTVKLQAEELEQVPGGE
jgi:hypothetical protein